MKKLPRVIGHIVGSACCTLALAACGGGVKQADSPGTCPEGTILQGKDCLPESAVSARSSGDDDSPKGNQHASEEKSSRKAPAGSAGGDGDLSSEGGSYDKEAVEAQLRRAAKGVKSNCGSASDEDGNKSGPWGSTSATVVLGRNGRVQDVSVPAPYAGKPVGDCVVNSFKKILFPPYAGSIDVSVTWDVEIVAPKQVEPKQVEPKKK